MPLHGLESGQILHLGVTFLVLRPHAERALHQQLPQLTHITLRKKRDEDAGIRSTIYRTL